MRHQFDAHLAEWGDNSVFGPGIYLRRALDVLGLMFLARFTHKPLRFFGSLGGTLMFAGALLVSDDVGNVIVAGERMRRQFDVSTMLADD